MAHNVNIKNLDIDYVTWSGVGNNGGGGGGDPLSLPMATINDLISAFDGAIKLPHGSYGSGRFAIDPAGGRIWASDHNGSDLVNKDFPVFECDIPAFVNNSSDLSALNTASQTQPLTGMLSKIAAPNDFTTADSTIYGMYYHAASGKIICTGARGYDASNPPASDTTFVIDDPSDLVNTTVSGVYRAQKAAKATQWISDVPDIWKPYFGNHLTGTGQGISIVTRLPLGPSVSQFDINSFLGQPSGTTFNTTQHIMWENNWIRPDWLNYEGASGRVNNDMFTTSTQLNYGFIIPGTRTLVLLGWSWGLNPGPLNYTQGTSYKGSPYADPGAPASNPYVGVDTSGVPPYGTITYKTPTIEDGADTFGFNVWDIKDQKPFYMLFDLARVQSSQTVELEPDDWGYFDMPFQKDPNSLSGFEGTNKVSGGHVDYANNKLYLGDFFAQGTQYPGNGVISRFDLSGFIS